MSDEITLSEMSGYSFSHQMAAVASAKNGSKVLQAVVCGHDVAYEVFVDKKLVLVNVSLADAVAKYNSVYK